MRIQWLAKILMALSTSSLAFGAAITVANSSFESEVTFTNSCCTPLQQWSTSIPSWTVTGTAGEQQGTATSTLYMNPFDGLNYAYINGNSGISQVLTTYVVPNTTYILSVEVGKQTQRTDGIAFSIVLSAGTTQLGVLNGNTLDFTGGVWQLETLEANSGSLSGQPLQITFTTTNLGQALFDAVSLSTAVPEPGTWVLVGLGGTVFLTAVKRRKPR
jgi:hypothetical protein